MKKLIASTLAAAADEDIRDEAVPFAESLCRHFALLFAAGATHPPPAPPSTKMEPTNGNAKGNLSVTSLKELDPYIFLEALIEVLSCHPPHTVTTELIQRFSKPTSLQIYCCGNFQAGELACMQVVKSTEGKLRAALMGLSVFMDTLLLVTEEQKKVKVPKPDEEGEPAGGSDAVMADAEAAGDLKTPSQGDRQGLDPATAQNKPGLAVREAAAKAAAKTAAEASKKVLEEAGAAGKVGHPVLHELVGKLNHACFGDNWHWRMGGAHAISLVSQK